MKNNLGRMLATGCLALLSGGLPREAAAWQPSGWLYHSGRFAYSMTAGAWYWLDSGSQMNCWDFNAGTWRQIGSTCLTSGWACCQWPYAYGMDEGSWFYLYAGDTLMCYRLPAGPWSRFGDAAPAGMALIPAGSNSGTDPDFGTYSLTVSAFYMDRCEVTKAQWDEVRAWGLNNGYADLAAGGGKAANHPVHSVPWYDCVKWCNARSQMENRTPAYYTTSAKATVYRTGNINIEDNDVNWSSGYRLPTDTEWQYAARGGVSNKRFPWGDTIAHDKANYYSDWYLNAPHLFYDTGYEGYDTRYSTTGYPYTAPVGSFPANGYELYDMAGNLWEWCWDWYPGYVGSGRVGRGGGWNYYAGSCRVAYLSSASPGDAINSAGFRAVLPITQ